MRRVNSSTEISNAGPAQLHHAHLPVRERSYVEAAHAALDQQTRTLLHVALPVARGEHHLEAIPPPIPSGAQTAPILEEIGDINRLLGQVMKGGVVGIGGRRIRRR